MREKTFVTRSNCAWSLLQVGLLLFSGITFAEVRSETPTKLTVHTNVGNRVESTWSKGDASLILVFRDPCDQLLKEHQFVAGAAFNLEEINQSDNILWIRAGFRGGLETGLFRLEGAEDVNHIQLGFDLPTGRLLRWRLTGGYGLAGDTGPLDGMTNTNGNTSDPGGPPKDGDD